MITIDNCIVEKDKQGEYRVTNPGDCQDKDFVKYLNCYDQLNRPNKEKDEECR